MKLDLLRLEYTERSTIGRLSIGNVFQCWTLEDRVRPAGVKVAGQTAISAGLYEVAISFSNRFQRQLPLLLNVPMFAGVRIHPGNSDVDTEGCILVGQTKGRDRLDGSRAAFSPLFLAIEGALRNGKVLIEIVDAVGDYKSALASQHA